MPKVKEGMSYPDVITRHQPSVLEGNNVAATDHGKDKYPRAYYKEDLRRDCDKGDMGTPRDSKLFPDIPPTVLKPNG